MAAQPFTGRAMKSKTEVKNPLMTERMWSISPKNLSGNFNLFHILFSFHNGDIVTPEIRKFKITEPKKPAPFLKWNTYRVICNADHSARYRIIAAAGLSFMPITMPLFISSSPLIVTRKSGSSKSVIR